MAFVVVQQPPGARHWCIGCIKGRVKKGDPDGIFESQEAWFHLPAYTGSNCARGWEVWLDETLSIEA
jgi:hypothetical protein